MALVKKDLANALGDHEMMRIKAHGASDKLGESTYRDNGVTRLLLLVDSEDNVLKVRHKVLRIGN